MDQIESEFCGYIEEKKLNKLTVARLREFAKAKELVKMSNPNKGSLIAMIEEFYK